MFKIKRIYLLIPLLIIALFFLNSCGKAECKANSDCLAKTGQKVSCIDKQCSHTIIPNFCGNDKQEEIEDGKPGNKCTCDKDYGKCEGRIKIGEGRKAVDSKFLMYHCDNDQCVLGVPEEEIREISLLDERDFSLFKLETTVTYNEPFDVKKDTFSFKISVVDDDDNMVFPIKINKIILKDGELLFGEKDMGLSLNAVGESIAFEAPVSFNLEKPEEVKRLSYKINYEHKKRVKDQRLSDGTYSYKNELVRDDYEKRFTTKINFVRSGAE
ncbi:hypothetical protein CMO94_03390 [Candidatus Woesearchaeota archaeon]|nr:hypothetical protein [Candidatus Woesearchaeota archaeon]